MNDPFCFIPLHKNGSSCCKIQRLSSSLGYHSLSGIRYKDAVTIASSRVVSGW